jgi:hypothetical protein
MHTWLKCSALASFASLSLSILLFAMNTPPLLQIASFALAVVVSMVYLAIGIRIREPLPRLLVGSSMLLLSLFAVIVISISYAH